MLSKTLFAIAGLAVATLAYDGQATYFYQNGNAGSCGVYHSDEDYVVALTYSHDPSGNCGRQVRITNKNNGNTQTATCADTCPSCEGADDLDLSVGLARALDSNYENDGVFPIEWDFI